jgi:hypothetical protein
LSGGRIGLSQNALLVFADRRLAAATISGLGRGWARGWGATEKSKMSAPVTVTITGTYNGVSKADTLVVNLMQIRSLTLSPATVIGGLSTTANRITLLQEGQLSH